MKIKDKKISHNKKGCKPILPEKTHLNLKFNRNLALFKPKNQRLSLFRVFRVKDMAYKSRELEIWTCLKFVKKNWKL